VRPGYEHIYWRMEIEITTPAPAPRGTHLLL